MTVVMRLFFSLATSKLETHPPDIVSRLDVRSVCLQFMKNQFLWTLKISRLSSGIFRNLWKLSEKSLWKFCYFLVNNLTQLAGISIGPENLGKELAGTGGGIRQSLRQEGLETDLFLSNLIFKAVFYPVLSVCSSIYKRVSAKLRSSLTQNSS